jgi:hypothetical protein
MKCSACQTEIPNYSTVCPKCGDNPQANPYQAPEATAAAKVSRGPENNEGDATGGIIPYKNPKALIAYYLGIFSGFPVIGFFLAIPALVLGIMGLRDRNRNPAIKGSIHAGIGIGCGGFFMLLWGAVIVFIIIGIITDGRRP